MMRISKIAIIMIALLCMTGCTIMSGSTLSSPTSYKANFRYLKGEKSHEMQLDKDDRVYVSVSKKENSGRLDLIVADSSGEEIYRGNHMSSMEFTLGIPETDTYTIQIVGKKARAEISLSVVE